MKAHSKSGKGFTLIELLVVIAIIGILAAILFPVFARARANAQRSACSSNLKQIALGVRQYAADYDEFGPVDNYFNNGRTYGWSQIIQPYIKSVQILQCPSDPYSSDPETAATFFYPAGFNDYYMNRNLFYGGSWNQTKYVFTTEAPIHESAYAAPALTVMLGDDDSGYNDNSMFEPPHRFSGNAAHGPGQKAKILLPSERGGWRHLEGANYAFADGHVKWLKPTQVSGGYACPASWYGAGNYTPNPSGEADNRARPVDDMGPAAATFNYRNND